MDAIGAPMSLDHVPLVASAFTSRMNLLERTWNAVSVMAMVYFRDWFIMPRVDRSPLVQHWPHGPVPSAVDVERNVSMMLTNTHPSLNYNFPKPPNIIEVGGLHCRLGRPLPAVSRLRFSFHLRHFLDRKQNNSVVNQSILEKTAWNWFLLLLLLLLLLPVHVKIMKRSGKAFLS